ncbi:hypothetical protein [Nonomuraea sp. CA-141351]|uniref:hypothetical protein n=1 Tax=Nonomuraea sp. CA-141351 TaxID=3239996 RepID=UPI003D8F6887
MKLALLGNKSGATRLRFGLVLKFFEQEARFPRREGPTALVHRRHRPLVRPDRADLGHLPARFADDVTAHLITLEDR